VPQYKAVGVYVAGSGAGVSTCRILGSASGSLASFLLDTFTLSAQGTGQTFEPAPPRISVRCAGTVPGGDYDVLVTGRTN